MLSGAIESMTTGYQALQAIRDTTGTTEARPQLQLAGQLQAVKHSKRQTASRMKRPRR
jgi:hypothetical protein